MNRRWTVLLVTLVAVVILAPVVMLLLAQPVGAPSTTLSPPTPTVAPSASPGEQGIDFTAATSPDDAAWYRIGRDPRVFPPRLEIGTTSGGVSFDVEFDWAFNAEPGATVPTRPVAGIADGVVVVVGDDGQRSTMTAIVAATGAAHDLVTSDDVILTAAVVDLRREVVFVTADRRSGELLGAWVVSLEMPDAPRPLAALVPAARADAIRLAAVSEFATWLMVSPDGSTVSLFRCVQLDCVLRAVRTDDGTLVGEQPVDRGWREPFALSGGLAFLVPLVPDGPERFGEVLDVQTGARGPIRIDPWPERSEAVGADELGDFLAVQTAGWTMPPALLGQPLGDPPAITVIGLPELELRGVLTLPLASVRMLPESDWTIGVDLPPGWLLAEASQPDDITMTLVAINVTDGTVVPLPGLGEILIQG